MNYRIQYKGFVVTCDTVEEVEALATRIIDKRVAQNRELQGKRGTGKRNLPFAVRLAARVLREQCEQINVFLLDDLEKAAQRLEEIGSARVGVVAQELPAQPKPVPPVRVPKQGREQCREISCVFCRRVVLTEHQLAQHQRSRACKAVQQAQQEPPALCGCGKPIHHHGMCTVRAAKAKARKAQNRQLQQQGKPRIGRPPNRAPAERRSEKWCSGCQALRPTAAFAKDATRRDGLQSRCRPCFNRRSKERYRRQKAVAIQTPESYEAVLAEKVVSDEEPKSDVARSGISVENGNQAMDESEMLAEALLERAQLYPDAPAEIVVPDTPPLRTHGLPAKPPKPWRLEDLTPEQQELRRQGRCVRCGRPKSKSPYASCRSCMGPASQRAEVLTVKNREVIN